MSNIFPQLSTCNDSFSRIFMFCSSSIGCLFKPIQFPSCGSPIHRVNQGSLVSHALTGSYLDSTPQLCNDSEFGHFSPWPKRGLICLWSDKTVWGTVPWCSSRTQQWKHPHWNALEFVYAWIYFYIFFFLKRFPIFWSNTCFRKCMKFSMDFIPFS